ncbi:MAG: hypothetical protein GX102_09505 [Porphyromonadaceae bacterium]|nr:hypothetical protein [Porphyromonadaceae bacterium]
MLRKSTLVQFIFFTAFLLLVSCGKSRTSYGTIAELDSMVHKYPRYVFSRAEQLSIENNSTYRQAYIGLLRCIAAYNSGQQFTSDSLINFVVSEFSKDPDFISNNYLRSLIYQGIIRNQLERIDVNSFLPIKQALDINSEKNVLDIKTKQLANYFLGKIHFQNNNTNTSHEYFKEALILAEKMQDSTVLFKTNREMYWNRMKAMDFNTARSLLESLQSFQLSSDAQIRDVKNAEAAFYNSRKNYRNALKIDYELMAQDLKKNDSVALLADYYRISDNYKFLGKLDSALYYGELAVKNIIDTTYFLNYHYYLNVAEIAAMKNDFEKSTAAFNEVYRLQNRAINQQLNTQILELERKYNVAAAESRAIRLKNSNLLLRLILAITGVMLILGYILYRNRIKYQREREISAIQEIKILEQEKQLSVQKEKQMLLDKELTERKLIEKQFVIPIYRQISQRNLDIKNFLLDLQSNFHIAKNQQLLEKIEKEYKNFIQTTKITDTQFLSDDLLAELTGISAQESKFFNESEKMMLAFIATGSDNQQMATLLNTSVESIRVRKHKLKKKMLDNGVKVPEEMEE